MAAGTIAALAQARAEGREGDLPRLIICSHEMVALSAVHAYALVSGQPSAVMVHVDGAPRTWAVPFPTPPRVGRGRRGPGAGQ